MAVALAVALEVSAWKKEVDGGWRQAWKSLRSKWSGSGSLLLLLFQLGGGVVLGAEYSVLFYTSFKC